MNLPPDRQHIENRSHKISYQNANGTTEKNGNSQENETSESFKKL